MGAQHSRNQVSLLAGKLTEFQYFFDAMSTEERQWVIQNTKAAIDLFANAIKNRDGVEVEKLLERLPITITVLTMKNFTAAEYFVIDTSLGSKVKISDLGPNFKMYFLPKVENGVVAAEVLSVYKLLKNAFDLDIVESFHDKSKVTIPLGQFFGAFAKQPNGEEGVLLTNGYAIIGFICDIEGIAWAVEGSWYNGGWRFEAIDRYHRGIEWRADTPSWRAGGQVISRWF